MCRALHSRGQEYNEISSYAASQVTFHRASVEDYLLGQSLQLWTPRLAV